MNRGDVVIVDWPYIDFDGAEPGCLEVRIHTIWLTERASRYFGESKMIPSERKSQFTDRQGQFLAFIHLYRRLHRQAPSEMDMVQYFRVTPPSVHSMVVKLEQLGLVSRERGVPRSVRVAIPEEEIPALEEVHAPPW